MEWGYWHKGTHTQVEQDRVLRSATSPKPTLTKELRDALYPLPERKKRSTDTTQSKRIRVQNKDSRAPASTAPGIPVRPLRVGDFGTRMATMTLA